MGLTKWIKQEKLRELGIAELKDRVAELKASIFTSRFQRSTGKLDNFHLLSESRHKLAAVLTLIHEKELATQAEGKEQK